MQKIITKAEPCSKRCLTFSVSQPDFVVKYGGSFMDSPDPAERHRVAREIVFLESVGINPVVVHEAGKRLPGQWKPPA